MHKFTVLVRSFLMSLAVLSAGFTNVRKVDTCPGGQSLCSGSCSTLATDSANCGACGTVCNVFQVCTAGVCQTNDPTLTLGVPIAWNTGSQITSSSDTILSVCDSTNASCLYAYTSSTNKAIAPPNMTTDANGLPFTIHAGNVAANATAARTAGNLVLAGGLDSKTAFAMDANPDTGGHCPGLTQTITSNGVAHNFVYNTYCTAGCTTQAAWCAAL